MSEYQGSCFCGAVAFAVSGAPAVMGYCHCESCRQWSGGPVNAFTLWPPAALTITRGANLIGTYNKTPISLRKWCTACGGHLFTEHPTLKFVDVFAAELPGLKFVPSVHVNYQETRLPMKDGLPKFRDFPADFGGSGVMAQE
ncbi:MAG TPA: GFA family protein [Steroidobacteraceae bacterium]|nr:GFA family protein [Steroidobacteraceae bacterium]